MDIYTDSWHYKYLRFGNVCFERPKSLCSYFWRLVWKLIWHVFVFIVMILVHVYAGIGLILYYYGIPVIKLELMPYIAGITIFCVFYGLLLFMLISRLRFN